MYENSQQATPKEEGGDSWFSGKWGKFIMPIGLILVFAFFQFKDLIFPSANSVADAAAMMNNDSIPLEMPII